MKKIIALAFLASTVAMPVFADDSSHMDHKMMADKMFKDADTNNDGFISKEEFAAHSQKKFDEMDTNHDGKISQEEMEAFHKKEKEEWKAGKSSSHMGNGGMGNGSSMNSGGGMGNGKATGGSGSASSNDTKTNGQQ